MVNAPAKSLMQEFLNIPNMLSVARILLIAPVCWLLTLGTPTATIWAVAIYLIVVFTDFLDGFLARRLNQITVIGKFLDPLADKLVVMAVLVIMLPMGRVPAWIVIVLLAREFAITGLRAIASNEGLVIQARSLGKFKTAFQMISLGLLMVFQPYTIDFFAFTAKIDFGQVGIWLLYVALFFSVASAVDYFHGFAKAMQTKREKDVVPT